MKESWIVKNNTGTAFHLAKCRITLTPEGRIDLVERLRKSVIELELIDEIQIAVDRKHLLTIEKISSSNETEMSTKLDDLIHLMSEKKESTPVAPQIPSLTKEDIAGVLDQYIGSLKDLLQKGGTISKEDIERLGDEEKMREDAMKTLIEKDKSKKEHNLADFGNERKIEDMDDFSDLIPG